MTTNEHATHRPGRRWWIALLAIALFGGALRLVVLDLAFPEKLIGDETYYFQTGSHIAQGKGHYSSFHESYAAWPPGQSYFVSRVLDAGLPPRWQLARVLRAEVLVGTLIIVATALLGRVLFDPRVGLTAGLVAAISPELVAFSHYLWAGSLFTALITTALIGIAVVPLRPRWLIVIGTGLLFGAATLTREAGLPIAAGGVLWWVWRASPPDRRMAAARGAVMLGVAVLTVLPWSLRNYAVLERVVPVATVGWLSLSVGNQSSRADKRAFNREYWSSSELERLDLARSEALERIGSRQPFWIFEKTIENLPKLFSLDSFVFYKISSEGYGEVPLTIVRSVLVATVLGTVLLLAIGTLGWIGAPRRTGFAMMAAAPLVALHIMALASPRYRLPLLPLLAIGTGFALAHPRTTALGLRGARGLLAVAVIVLVLAAAASRFHPEAVALWSTGHYTAHHKW